MPTKIILATMVENHSYSTLLDSIQLAYRKDVEPVVMSEFESWCVPQEYLKQLEIISQRHYINNQVIIPTFNTELEGAQRVAFLRGIIDSADLYIFDNKGNHFKTISVNINGRRAEWLPGMFDSYEKILSELSRARNLKNKQQ